jgi:hypothetical protein
MSGYASHAAIRPGPAEQRAEFIRKPFSPDQLARKIREMLTPG